MGQEWSLQETGGHNNVLVVAFYTREGGGYVSSNISKALKPCLRRMQLCITFLSLFSCDWERPRSWEHFGNFVGTLQEVHENQGITYSVLYKYNMVCYIVHALYCTIPTYCTISTYYTIPTYCTISTYYTIPTHCTLQWKVYYKGQHPTSILSIHLSLDNDYGTIIS
jgi:hypothetical protein